MLTMQIPMLLALLATALMAVVIFAPSRVPAAVTTSFAPPPAPPAVERWEEAPAYEPPAPEPAVSTVPAWPALIDRRATGCDAAARLGLVDALASLRTPWSDAILYGALDNESDPVVRAAVVTALGATVRYPDGLA